MNLKDKIILKIFFSYSFLFCINGVSSLFLFFSNLTVFSCIFDTNATFWLHCYKLRYQYGILETNLYSIAEASKERGSKLPIPSTR